MLALLALAVLSPSPHDVGAPTATPDAIRPRVARLLGARSQGEVHGFYVAQLRRRMGVTAVREFARHRLRRAAYVGVPRAVVEQMMQQEAMRVRLHGQPAADAALRGFLRVGGAAAGGGARRRWRLSAGGRGGAAARLRAASP